MAHPQTIQIFLPDGNPRGIKIAEITNRTIKAILFPRNQFESILRRPELTNVGFYFLFGEAENGHEMAYIGEAEDCAERLKQHQRNKDFWNYAVVIISQTHAFTKGEFYQFNLSSCIRQQNSLTAQFVSFSLSNLANIFYPPQFLQ